MNESESHVLLSALADTGFTECEFPPDGDPCDQCKKTDVQLYFGNASYWDSREGEYLCAKCVVDLHNANQEAIRQFGG